MKTLNEVKEFVKNDESYSFLSTEPKLKNLCLLTLGGSLAYGTYRTDENGEILSDIDVRGIVVSPKETVYGLNNFEQFEHKETDTVIYDIRKYVQLAYNCNPNTIELLSNDSNLHIYCNDIGKLLIDNRQLFLSKLAVKSFGGYAYDQFQRLQSAICHDAYNQSEQEQHLLNTLNKLMIDYFPSKYSSFDEGQIKLYIDKAVNEELDEEIFLDCNLSHYPLRDYKNIWSDMQSIVKTYGKLNNRNKKKDELHLCKHAMHLIRLYLMGIDILEKGEINTARYNDLELLQSIRNGKYLLDNGKFDVAFFDLVNEYEKKFNEAAENSKLPKTPDINKINQMMIEVFDNCYNK